LFAPLQKQKGAVRLMKPHDDDDDDDDDELRGK
jgi:hypothetical protein